jgi:hypothetical protein
MDFKFVKKKLPGPLQRGDNHKNVKMRWGHLKILFLKTMNPEKAEFHMKVFLYRIKARLLKSWAPKGRMGQMEMDIIFLYG